MKLRGVDLFSGIGGLGLGLSEWVRPVLYCERDLYCQAVLFDRMRTGCLELAPIWDDVRTLGREQCGDVDIVVAGFPCQDISAAGAGRGLAGERSGLYFEVERVVRETSPPFVFLENVPAIRSRGLDRVAEGLARLGYDLRWTTLSASSVGAPHLRRRWFAIAYSDREYLRLVAERVPGGRARELCGEGEAEPRCDGAAEPLAYADGRLEVGGLAQSRRLEGERRREPDGRGHSRELDDAALANSSSASHGQQTQRQGWKDFGGGSSHSGGSDNERRNDEVNEGWWTVEPDVGRVAHGSQFRVDRLRCLGNAVVPAQARAAFARLLNL